MKKIIFLLLFLPSLTWGQNPIVVEKPVICDYVTEILSHLKDKYKEEPIWVGKDQKSRYSLFVNPNNGQFTIIQFNNEIACVLGIGDSSFNLPSKPTL